MLLSVRKIFPERIKPEDEVTEQFKMLDFVQFL